MTASSGKDTRIQIYFALLLMYTISIMEFGMHLISPFAHMSTLLIETRPTTTNMRHTLNEEIEFSRKMASERNNEFVLKFSETLSNNQTSGDNFASLVLKDNKLYCRESQMKALSRGKYFVQMLRQGLMQNPIRTPDGTPWIDGIPILIKHDDSNGCYPATHSDNYGFPRLTWSVPADITGHESAFSSYSSPPTSWCSAIGMPSYKIWRDLKNDTHKFLSSTMDNDNVTPWNAKLSKAVWRGSTTYNNGMYGHLPFLELPRSRLVKSSMERPDLIDAGFHKLVGKFDKLQIDDTIGEMMKEVVPMKEMMRYKAIIDIDGNNWSARFPSLLCTNSIIIKITPDFVEQTTDTLQPNIHFIPSSLDNLTTVVENVMDGDNDEEMKNIVSNANWWCHSNIRKEYLSKRAVDSLEKYIAAIDQHVVKGWPRGLVQELGDDLVECTV